MPLRCVRWHPASFFRVQPIRTVSIFDLVFGVAASATDSRVVLLAGATGAAAAAIAMMTGTYLDAELTRDQAKARIASAKQAIERNCPSELQKMRERLRGAGLNDQNSNTVIDVLDRHPVLLLRVETALLYTTRGLCKKFWR